MCGIAALQLRNPSLHPRMGSLLSSMLCQIVDRGPDSAGLAVNRVMQCLVQFADRDLCEVEHRRHCGA